VSFHAFLHLDGSRGCRIAAEERPSGYYENELPKRTGRARRGGVEPGGCGAARRAESNSSSRMGGLRRVARNTAAARTRQMLVHGDDFAHQRARAPFFRVERTGRGQCGAFGG
jgi:hypothetical protein